MTKDELVAIKAALPDREAHASVLSDMAALVAEVERLRIANAIMADGLADGHERLSAATAEVEQLRAGLEQAIEEIEGEGYETWGQVLREKYNLTKK